MFSDLKDQRLVFRLYRDKKKYSCPDFPENGDKLFIYLRVFRESIVCQGRILGGGLWPHGSIKGCQRKEKERKGKEKEEKRGKER